MACSLTFPTFSNSQKNSMSRENQSWVSDFLLLWLPIWPEQLDEFLALFLVMYLTTVLGDLFIILLNRLDPDLHTPCLSSSVTWCSQMSPFQFSLSLTCSWTFRLSNIKLPMQGPFIRCVFPQFLVVLTISYLQWWRMTGIWPYVRLSTTEPPWGKGCMSL